MNLELKKAIDQISKDKGLDRDMLIDTLEDAVRTSVLRRFSEDMDVEVTYNDDTGDIEVYQFKIVVEDDDVANEDTQIALADAREHDPSVQLDDEMGFRVKVEDLGRIAAQSAKQVIIQRMRDAEQEIIYEEYKDRVGEICSGIIQRRDKGGWIIKKHLVPNCIGTVVVTTTFQIPSSIFTESFLSFIGLGVSAPMASLGSLVNDALNGFQTAPYRLFVPAAVLALIILAMNQLGDGLRDALDPKMRT